MPEVHYTVVVNDLMRLRWTAFAPRIGWPKPEAIMLELNRSGKRAITQDWNHLFEMRMRWFVQTNCLLPLSRIHALPVPGCKEQALSRLLFKHKTETRTDYAKKTTMRSNVRSSGCVVCARKFESSTCGRLAIWQHVGVIIAFWLGRIHSCEVARQPLSAVIARARGKAGKGKGARGQEYRN